MTEHNFHSSAERPRGRRGQPCRRPRDPGVRWLEREWRDCDGVGGQTVERAAAEEGGQGGEQGHHREEERATGEEDVDLSRCSKQVVSWT